MRITLVIRCMPIVRMIRNRPSLRTYLILLLVALVVVATVSLGSIAYKSSRSTIEDAAVREVGIIANARSQALLRELTSQKARAAALLKTASLGCEPDETWCVRKVLNDYVGVGGATAARLVYRGRRPIEVGSNARALSGIPIPPQDELARFGLDAGGQPYYVVGAQAVLEDDEMSILLRGDLHAVAQIFLDRYGLGNSGETFLTDHQGRFLTPHKYVASSPDLRLGGDNALHLCLAGKNAEVLDRDYRGVPVIHGFRNIPEIGGGCVIAQIDQAEAFAPANQLRKRVALVSGLLAVLAIACSCLFAQLISRPIYKLELRARSLQGGDYDSAVPVGGPSDVRTFAQTFQSMAHSLKESRLALVRSTEQISDILESMSEGFCAFDGEWRCTHVNARGAALSRMPREQLLGKTLWELLPVEVGAAVRPSLDRALSEHVAAHFEQYYSPFDAWFEISAYPTRDGIAFFGRDVTERKRFSERLQQIQKLESLGVLAGGIAHDFNNLLTGIMGHASIALEDVPRGSHLHAELEKVVEAGERAATLTRQLLAYAGKGRFVIEPLNLSEVVQKISNLIRSSIPKTAELRLRLDHNLPPIDGDAAQIQQLVMNLVINGAEAIGADQHGTVVVETSVKEVDRDYLQQTFGPTEVTPGRYVMLEVSDTGCGMDEATVSRIFDPFFTTKFSGRGLGLAAVMGIVRGHKGALRVYSAPGKGSSFKLLFPASKNEAPGSEPSVVFADLTGEGTILVIDDEEMLRELVRSALTHYGYTVLLAQNGQEGLEIVRKYRTAISLILLDMTMPVMSGEETLRRLKQIEPDIPVILCSGYHEVEFEQLFALQGMEDFIQKPFTAQHLAERVKVTLTKLKTHGRPAS